MVRHIDKRQPTTEIETTAERGEPQRYNNIFLNVLVLIIPSIYSAINCGLLIVCRTVGVCGVGGVVGALSKSSSFGVSQSQIVKSQAEMS